MDKNQFLLDMREEPSVMERFNQGNTLAILITIAALALAVILFIYFKKKKNSA